VIQSENAHNKKDLAEWKTVLTGRMPSGIVSQMANLDRVFHSLADSTRRAVITQLAGGPASVGELARRHSMALPSFMKHVRILEASKIVVSRKKGRVRICELSPRPLSLAQNWIEKERRIWATRLNQLDAFVETLAEKEKTHGNQS
jgi:DNA-binding transcriptional ArsR family regulator